jgi:hypothetical protein
MSENRKPPLPLIIIGGGVLILLAALAWGFLNHKPASVATPTPATVAEVQRVSLVDAKEAFDAGTAVFLDVRDSNSYAISHVPGAVLMPANELTDRLKELNPSSWIITYCT